MEKVPDVFENRILARIYTSFACIFTLFYAWEFSFSLYGGAPLRVSALLAGGFFLNAAALAIRFIPGGILRRVLPAGIAFTVMNILLRQITLLLTETDPARFAIESMIYPFAILALSFYTRKFRVSVAVSAYILLSFILVQFIFPRLFFENAVLALPSESKIVIESFELLLIGLVSALVLISMNQILYTSRQNKQRYFQKLSHYDQETGLPNIRELSAATTAKISETNTGNSVLVLAGLRIVKLDELSEKLGYENMINWLMRFSAELSASLDLWVRGLSGSKDQEMLQLYRLESSLLIFPVILPKNLYDAMSPLSETWARLVLDVLRKEHIESLVDFYGAFTAYPADGASSSELLNNLLNVLHRSTPDQRTTFIPFSESSFDQYLRKERLKEQMGSDSFGAEVYTVFQPKVSVLDETCHEFEALGRWKNPILGLISPGEFIPLAEQIGAIGVATRKTLEDTKQFIERCRADGLGETKVSFNLSPALISRDYLTTLSAWIQNNNLGANLEVEITEGILLNSTTELEQDFAIIKETGCSFAIDDFGTGYSNLSYLQHFNAEVIKIDKCFVDRVPADSKSCNLIQAIVLMVKAFGMICVAEGVENEAQLDFLREAGCDLIQGYHFAKPLDGEAARDFMRARNS
jgi:EAL domain-containing protein (putative c-di-GMP-specific phosphodiesterase class I)